MFSSSIEALRFFQDKPRAPGMERMPLPRTWINSVDATELLICRELTPDLFLAFESVVLRLGANRKNVKGYIYQSHELNAYSSFDDKKCIIRVSSSLVRLLDIKEFQFVIGHELGHFLFQHQLVDFQDSQSLRLSRAQEISADRLGLLGCDSFESAIKAILKFSFGLDSTYINFDVGFLVSRLNSIDFDNYFLQSSHPFFSIRCRAILWFSLLDYKLERNFSSERDLLKVDERITRDIKKWTTRSNSLRIEFEKELRLWTFVSEVVAMGSFNKNDQQVFETEFGSIELVKLKNFLSGDNKTRLMGIVSNKIEAIKSKIVELEYF
ncbi:M48 family metallopeptidase [Vibrio breoganii]